MQPTRFDVWAVGITIVIGGQYFSWNAGLFAGSVSYGIAVGLMGAAYLCLILCMAEMTSMMPFAGGAYGLGRCTLGFFTGFLLGCCETLEYVLYVTCAFLTLSRMLSTMWPSLDNVKYIVWAASYLAASVPLVLGGRVFWVWNRVIAVVSLVTLLVFCIGSLPYLQGYQADFFVVGGMADFLSASPKAAWFFVGIEAVSTLSSVVGQPKSTIPRGQVASMVTLLVTAAWTYLVSIQLPPGLPTLATELSPLNRGFTRLFGISNDAATLLAVPATFATAQGFMLSYSNIIVAMANSKLLPDVLAKRRGPFGTPANALACGTFASFGLCFAVDYWSMDGPIYSACILFAFVAYIAQCVGYIFLKRRHTSAPRKFRSPVGIAGAVFATGVWALNIVALMGFQDDPHTSLIVVAVLVLVCSIYYHVHAKHVQSFSDEEQKIMLFVHIANHNNSKPRSGHRQKKNRVRGSGESGPRLSGTPKSNVTVQPSSGVSSPVAPTSLVL